ncbi:MAG: putative membrane protein YgcG [Phycisphaerales bacterium]|jgi:uncharacterized membrane protein YgcG
MEFPNFGGRIGPDPERASRVFHFAHTQPSWAARMAAFIFSVLLLLAIGVILLPLILLALLVVAAMMLIARIRVALLGLRSGGRGRGGASGGPKAGGRKNVRVRR